MPVTTEMEGLPCPMYICFQIAVPLETYIQRWGWPDDKLIYRGHVFLTIEEAVELISRREGKKDEPKKTKRAKQYISHRVGDKPPCIEEVERNLLNGVEVGHFERFLLATWYISKLDHDQAVTRLVELFSHSPDFDPKKTEYQIRHIAGQTGGRKKYSVPSCSTVLANGACPTGGTCGVKSPVAYGKKGPIKLVIRHE